MAQYFVRFVEPIITTSRAAPTLENDQDFWCVTPPVPRAEPRVSTTNEGALLFVPSARCSRCAARHCPEWPSRTTWTRTPRRCAASSASDTVPRL